MGRVKELLKKFIEPKPEEPTFNELAIASGISEKDLKELNDTINGISWNKFSGENTTKKKDEKAITDEKNRTNMSKTKKKSQNLIQKENDRER